MSIDEILQRAVESTGLPCSPNLYTGSAREYATWNYSELPEVFADGAPHAARYLIQVHYFLPTGKSPSSLKQDLRLALFYAGCTWPNITNASDNEGQHYVFECEYADGGGYYGQP